MNDFHAPRGGVASGGYSLDFGKLRNWILVAALLLGVFASALASQTTAYAKPDVSKTMTGQDISSPTPDVPFTPTVNYTKTGPASVNPGSAATYKLSITNSDPITYAGYILDQYPAELTYTGAPIISTDNYFCIGGSEVITLSVSLPKTAHSNVAGPPTGIVICQVLIGANSTVSIDLNFTANGPGGDCFTNLSDFIYFPIFFNPVIPTFKSKEDVVKNLQALENSPLPFTDTISDFTTCINKEESKPPADLIAQLRVSPDRTDFIDPTGDISYTLTVKNVGVGQANYVQVKFPFDSNLDVGYLTSLDPNVWVSAIDTTSNEHFVTINLPNIQQDGVYSATLVMRPSATAVDGAVEFNRFTVKWDDAEHPGKTAGSNGVRYGLSDQPGSTLNLTGGEVQLFDPAEATVNNGQEQIINGDFFAPGEKVTAWYTDPDGNSTALGSANAGPNGEISITISPLNLTPGDKYVIAAYGNRSEVYGNSVITIGS